MGSSHSPPTSPAFADAFAAAADADGWLSFAEFMQLALYHPQLGYYRRDRARVGRTTGTDFYTASSLGPIFGELVVAAVIDLLGPATAKDFTFVEIGAEPGGGILAAKDHPFGDQRTITVADPVELAGPCVVFSNELFDAQPCRRFVRAPRGWQEIGVELHERQLQEVPRPAEAPWADFECPIGYRLDAPMAAVELCRQIAAQPWHGLFLAFDYGKSWHELTHETPTGTVRAYHQHRQITDLLARPGNQDLTCHVCWDWLGDALREHGFLPAPVLSQEHFLVRHTASTLQTLMANEASGFSSRKGALMHLLHPTGLGHKFQVLSATRGFR